MLFRAVLAGVVLAIGAGALPASSQVLRLDRVEAEDGVFTYWYQTHIPPTQTLVRGVRLDVRGTQPGRVSRWHGEFLFDATTESDRSVAGHAVDYVGTPAGWSAAIHADGVLAWDLDQPPILQRGRSHPGFVLRGRGLPSLRPWRAVYAGAPLVTFQGTVVAPGPRAKDVTRRFLVAQVEVACKASLLSACGRYRTMASHPTPAALRSMLHHLHRDPLSDEHARRVLVGLVQALLGAGSGTAR